MVVILVLDLTEALGEIIGRRLQFLVNAKYFFQLLRLSAKKIALLSPLHAVGYHEFKEEK